MNNRSIIGIIFRRIISSFFLLLILISVLFVLLRLSPGDPTQKYLSPELSPELKTRVEESFGLNDPVIEQYFKFIVNFIGGDLGISYDYKLPVIQVISQFLPFTILFAVVCFLIQIGAAGILSISSMRFKNNTLNNTLESAMIILYAMPVFVLGVLLIYFLSVKLDLFPISGFKSFDHEELSFFGGMIDYISHLFLPVLTLSLVGIPIFYRYLRENLEDIYNRTFVMNLRAAGFAEGTILLKHVVPNALKPLISVAGIELGFLLSGAVITEVIFGLPGFGRLTLSSIYSRDYPLIVGCSFISGIFIILSNFLADLLKVIIDKRLLRDQLN